MRRQDFMLNEKQSGRFIRIPRILIGILTCSAILLLMIVPSHAESLKSTPKPGNVSVAFIYEGQPGTPAYLQNTFHPADGCQWLGVAGQVINAESAPVPGLTVKLGGSLGGATQSIQAVTGTATDYGPGGFEFVLGNKPQASMQSLWLQVYDSAGKTLSEKVYFNTYNECSKNLILVNFIAASAPPTSTPRMTSTFLTSTKTRTAIVTKPPAATKTRTPIKTLIPTSTPTRTITPRVTATPTPQKTLRPSATPTKTIVPPAPSRTKTKTPAATGTISPTAFPTTTGMPFLAQYVRQPGSPAYQTGFAHPEKGCAWMGIAGQVFDTQGKPVRNIVVEVQGALGSERISSLTLTGLSPAYGVGGYELRLADSVSASQGSLNVILYDLKGNRLSAMTEFNTIADCKRNLILINFIPIKQGGSSTPPPPTEVSTATQVADRTPPPNNPKRFEIQADGPLYTQNKTHPELGCRWMGIAGQVFLKNGTAARDIIIESGGMLEGKPVFGLGLTGASPKYGVGGYEIRLADHPIASKQDVWVVVKRLDGSRLSEHVYLDTRAGCAQNLILVNFVETGAQP